MDTNHYIYLIQEREFIRLNENVFKIGKTTQMNDKRFSQYPKGSKLLFQSVCNDCHLMEKIIKNLFSKKYKKRSDIGSEYFEGDYREMIIDIFRKIFPMKKVEEKKEEIKQEKVEEKKEEIKQEKVEEKKEEIKQEKVEEKKEEIKQEKVEEKKEEIKQEEIKQEKKEITPIKNIKRKISRGNMRILNSNLMWALENWDLEAAKKYIEKGADPKTRNNYALIESCRCDQLDFVEYLVSVGVNIKSGFNEAVIVASQYGHLEVVKYLVSLGANIKAQDNKAVNEACRGGYFETVKYLVSLGGVIKDINKALMWMENWLSDDRVEMMKYLVSLGADIKAQFDDLIIKACSSYGYMILDTVKYLVSIGANPKARNNSCIKKAGKYGHLETVKYLVSLGVDIKALNYPETEYPENIREYIESLIIIESLNIIENLTIM